MKAFLVFFISAIVVSCSSLSEPKRAALDDKIGWLHGNCLAIKNASIPPYFQFTLVHLNTENTIEKATIKKRATDSDDCYPLLDDRVSVNTSAGYFFYTVDSKEPVNLAIGILNPEDISVSALNFSYCTTSEGVKFSASKNSSSVWEGYYYLGYESEPTCASE